MIVTRSVSEVLIVTRSADEELRSRPARSVSERLAAGALRGFTLVEVLIVAIIISVMAATIIPQFSSSARDAKWSSLKFNLQSIRSQLEKYREQHLGVYPPAASSADFTAQLTNRTDQTTTLNAGGSCGPYLDEGIPANPFNGGASVAIVRGETPPAGPTGSNDGWQYNPAHGWFYPNNGEYFQTGRDMK